MYLTLILAALLISATSDAATLDRRSFKVYHGDIINSWDLNPYKFIVALVHNGLCTGSVYSAYTVVSAGHCFRNPEIKPSLVGVQVITIKTKITKGAYIENVFMPEAYTSIMATKPVNGFDFAVVTLKTPILGKGYDVVVADFVSVDTLPYYSVVTIVGYGKDSYRKQAGGQLEEGKQVYNECARNTIIGDPICVYPKEEFKNQDSEVGDSGGPLLYKVNGKLKVFGVLSGGVTFGGVVQTSVYAPLAKHYAFLQKMAK